MHQVNQRNRPNRVRMEARLPVSIRDHGATAPNPVKLSQLDRIWSFAPKSPQGTSPLPSPRGGGGSLDWPGVNSTVLTDTTRTQATFLK